MSQITRRWRSFATGIASVLPTTWAASRSASDEIRNRERVVMAGAAHAFMEEYDVPGLAVAISREVRLVYAQSLTSIPARR
jgi:hypothetical protein